MKLLTETTAIPAPSFSLPARTTCPGAVFTPGSVCAACYADGRGRYRWPGVKRAQAERLSWTRSALVAGSFAQVMVEHIRLRGEPYFRIHDAGDFFSAAYVEVWIAVATALPLVRFWAPTHSWAVRGHPRRDSDPLLRALRRLAALPNVAVRPSALRIGDPPPQLPGFSAGSAVTTDHASATCPKSLRTPSNCGDCRRCWDDRLVPVTYLKH
ncbi:MAG: hypothetical protein ABIT01_01310 [Thermoanaerobaculia bacterium]